MPKCPSVLQPIAGFLGWGLLLGLIGSYLAGFLFLNVTYIAAIFAIAIIGDWPSPFPGLYLLRYTVPVGLVSGLAVGVVWERSVRSGVRWWRIAVAIWTGLLIGGFPVSVLLMLASGYILLIGFLPGLLAGLVWSIVIAAFTLFRHHPLRDPEQYHRSATRLSVALMLPVGPLALIVGLSVIVGREGMIELLREFVPGSSIDSFSVFYLAVGLCSAIVARFLAPFLTGWYVTDSREDPPLPDTLAGAHG